MIDYERQFKAALSTYMGVLSRLMANPRDPDALKDFEKFMEQLPNIRRAALYLRNTPDPRKGPL